MGLFDSKKVNIQITEQFTDSASKLNQETKAKIVDVQNKLFNNPKAKGLNLEAIKSAVDDVYSIRVDQSSNAYRIILLYPHNENGLFIFLYVDTHDKAYDWAARFKYDINQYGGFQIYEGAPEKTTATKLIARLASVSDEQLRHIEIPEYYWESLRKKTFTKKQLQAYKDVISEPAMLILESVFDGSSSIDNINTLYNELTVSPFEDIVKIPEPLFQAYSYSELSRIGVPEEYIDIVKSIKFKSELSDLQCKLPKDSVQGLYCLLNGESVDDIVKLANSGSKPTDSIKVALNNDNSKGAVVQISTTEELENILNCPMEKWRLFLHPQQRGHAYRHYNGAARVLGGAGTGKTVISVHHAKFLAQNSSSSDRILVTTFSNTLADDINKRLRMVCSPYELKKIDVMTVNKLAHSILSEEKYYIKYDNSKDFKTGQNLFSLLWNNAKVKAQIVGYDNDFLIDEWTYVIQGLNIKTKEEYFKASRTGRGKQLNQKARESVWAIFEEYRSQIEYRRDLDIDYAENKIAEMAASNSRLRKYSSIIVDECQDLRAPAIRMLRALSGNPHEDDMFFAGDTRQSIYNKIKVKLSLCNVAINNRSTILKLNYRTTSEIYNLAFKLQQEYKYDDLDGMFTDHDKSICVYHGDVPTIKGFHSFDEEMRSVLDDIRRKVLTGFSQEEICVVARQVSTVTSCADFLSKSGTKVLQLKNDVPDDKTVSGIRVATMHRVKGMEFDCMYVVGVNSDIMPPKNDIKKAEGTEEIETVIEKDANLLSVAITRARKTVWISYNGTPSRYINVISKVD